MCVNNLPAFTSVRGCWILELQTAVSCHMVLGMEPGFSGRTVNAANHWTISPTLTVRTPEC